MTAFPTGSTEAMNRDAKRARRLIAASRLALWWERAWEASWRGLTTLGATAALALFDVWTSFPGWLRLACVFALIAAGLVFFWRDWRAVRWPTRDEAVRRLERRNGVAHRPLASMDDALASGGDDPLAAELWRRHVARQTAALAGLELAWPKPDLPSRDVYALRGLAFLGVIGGLAVAGGDAPARLAAALSPDDERAVSAPALAVDAWIAPPVYTGLAPILLTQARGALPLEHTGAVSAPAGSKLSIRLNAPGEPVIERLPARHLRGRVLRPGRDRHLLRQGPDLRTDPEQGVMWVRQRDAAGLDRPLHRVLAPTPIRHPRVPLSGSV